MKDKELKEKLEWLDHVGYEKVDYLPDSYRFHYRNGDYNAICTFDYSEIATIPFDHLKQIHADFMEKAKNKEIF
jgi:hypothetical protein